MRQGRERPEKILVAMYMVADGDCRFVKYEDIVVKAYRVFPDEFALRGYPEYPDSSDIHKPLYGILKRRGLVRAAAKAFALTPRGTEVAKHLIGAAGSSLEDARNPERLDRDDRAEIERLLKSAAFKLFRDGEKTRILDTDFYAFFGCTVRTGKNDFLGRLHAVREAVKAARNLSRPDARTAAQLSALLFHLLEQFKQEIDVKENHV